MRSFWKFFRVLCAVFLFVGGVVAALYFFNLDQRLLGWGYRRCAALRESEMQASRGKAGGL